MTLLRKRTAPDGHRRWSASNSTPSTGACSADSFDVAVRPPNGETTFRYRVHLQDGSDAREATYAQMIHCGDEIHLEAGQRFRVLDVVIFEEEDESPFVGLLQVEAA